MSCLVTRVCRNILMVTKMSDFDKTDANKLHKRHYKGHTSPLAMAVAYFRRDIRFHLVLFSQELYLFD